MNPINSVAELEDELSRPTKDLRETLAALPGDVMLLGAGGKMGPTLARMARRALDEIGKTERKVIAVSRFSSPEASAGLQKHGVETISCDLLDRAAVAALPEAENIIFMAGQKFGTSGAPELTWVMNTLLPGIVAERFKKSRIVVMSTACVYPLMPVDGPGASETDPLGPPGEYANSCIGRERIFTYYANLRRSRALMLRLSYAIDLRYGVLCDVAQKVAQGRPVDLTMGTVNVIWQGDANSRILQCLHHTASPPAIMNISGKERVSIRWLAECFGKLLERKPHFTGQESPTAWLVDTSKMFRTFPPLAVSLEEMIQATAHWVREGGVTLGKPTHFESADGQF